MVGVAIPDAAALARLLETLYQAVEDPNVWPSVVRLLCQYLNADSGMIQYYSSAWSTMAFTATYGCDSSSTAAYQQYFLHLDPVSGAIECPTMPLGEPAFLPGLISGPERGGADLYKDEMSTPQDKRRSLGVHLLLDHETGIMIGLQRDRLRQPFALADQSSFHILTPHFRRVIRLWQALCRAGLEASAAAQVLDNLKIAAFFLDREGNIRFANARAEAEVHSGLLLTLRGRRLHAVQSGCDRILQQLVAGANAPKSGPLPAAGGVLRLATCDEAGHAVVAFVTPWTHPIMVTAPLGSGLTSAVFVGAPERPRLQAAVLASAFGLTGAEARLATRLVETCDLAKAADAAGVTISTARSYLKSIFDKTNTHSQLELVTLILTSPSGLWGRKINDRIKVPKSAIAIERKSPSSCAVPGSAD